MLRHLGLIAVCACIVASVGCDGGKVTAPAPPATPSSDPNTTVTVEFGGRVVNFDAGGPVGNVRVSLEIVAFSNGSSVRRSNGRTDGSFRRTVQRPVEMAHLPSDSISRVLGRMSYLNSPVRLDTTIRASGSYRHTPADRPAIRMYPTLVIRPGESIEVRVDSDVITYCWWGFLLPACRGGSIAGRTRRTRARAPRHQQAHGTGGE